MTQRAVCLAALHRRFVAATIGLAVFVAPGVVRADDGSVEYIEPIGLHSLHRLGPEVAVHDDRMLAGAFDPELGGVASAVVLERGDTGWAMAAVLRHPDAYTTTRFGSRVALWGDVAVVGDLENPYDPDLVYIYRRTSDGTWPLETVIDADGGAAIVLHENVLVVGGQVFEFDGTSWNEGVLATPEAVELRTDVIDVWGERIAAATMDDTVVVFERRQTAWETTAVLEPPGLGSLRGDSIAIWEDTIAVGASGANTGATFDRRSNPGAVTVFERDAASGEWRVTATLVNPHPDFAGRRDYWGATWTSFGAAIDLRGDLLVVGAPDHMRDPDTDQLETPGACFTFVRRKWTDGGTRRSDWSPRAAHLGRSGFLGGGVATDGAITVAAPRWRSWTESTPGLTVLNAPTAMTPAEGALRVDRADAQPGPFPDWDPTAPTLVLSGELALPTGDPGAGDRVVLQVGMWEDFDALLATGPDDVLVAEDASRSARLELHPRARSTYSFVFTSYSDPSAIAGWDLYGPLPLDGTQFLRVDVGDQHVVGEFTMVDGVFDRHLGIGAQARPGIALGDVRVRRRRARGRPRDDLRIRAYLSNDGGEPAFAMPLTVEFDGTRFEIPAERVRGLGTFTWTARARQGRARFRVDVDWLTGFAYATVRRADLGPRPDGESPTLDVAIEVGAQRHAARVTAETRAHGRIVRF